MIYENPTELRERIEQVTGRRTYGPPTVFEDTSDYMAIHGGTVLRVGGTDYFVLGDTREGRFGIEEQPKFWVKYAVDLGSGANKIIKLVYHEQFTTQLGRITIQCRRSPVKESAFLDLVRGHPRFMQGLTVTDPVGNAVRVIDFIRGPSLFRYVNELEMPHERYFHEVLPGVMRRGILPCIEAMAEVHRQGQIHGDIRNDHILVESETGRYVWIDFDYEVNYSDYDVWSMGNVLTFVVGQGMHTFHDVARHPEGYPYLAGSLDDHDALVLYRNRVANLRKLFPYIPPELNSILMRFSVGTIDFFESLDREVEELRALYG